MRKIAHLRDTVHRQARLNSRNQSIISTRVGVVNMTKLGSEFGLEVSEVFRV
jgi:hypothetical protein